MKKLLCMALALLMLAGTTLTALAEAQPTVTPDPGITQDASGGDAADDSMPDDTPDPNATPAPDRTVDVDGQFTFVCSGSLVPIDIDQQDKDDGLLYSAYNDTMGVDVYKYPQGGDTLQSLYDSYKADDSMSEVTLADVGKTKVLVYRIDETGIDATVQGDTGFLYDIMFTYQTPEEYQQLGQMIGSILKTGA
jgi:hypothetical protein